jgi:hypothetical protein
MAVAVAGPADALDEIDRELWSFAAAEFLPHSRIERAGEVPQALHATTIWLGENPIDAPLHSALLNLGPLPPPAFETFERLFEVVSLDEAIAKRRAGGGRRMRAAAIRSSVTRSAHEHATAAGIDPDPDRGRQRSAGGAAVAARGGRAGNADAGDLRWRGTATAATRCRSVEPARADSSAGCDECTDAEQRAFADSGNCIADLCPGGDAGRAAGARGDSCACAVCRFAARDVDRPKARVSFAGAAGRARSERCDEPPAGVAAREGACAFRDFDAAGACASGSRTGGGDSGSRGAARGGVGAGGHAARACARGSERCDACDVPCARTGDGTEHDITSSGGGGCSAPGCAIVHGCARAGACTGSRSRLWSRSRADACGRLHAGGRSRARESASVRSCTCAGAGNARGCRTACAGDVHRSGDRVVACTPPDTRFAGRACRDAGAGTRADPGTRCRRRTSNSATPEARSHGRRTRQPNRSRECLGTRHSNPERARCVR